MSMEAPVIDPEFALRTDLHGLGEFRSSAYGPPWDEQNGSGITKGGTDLRDCDEQYVVAVDPAVIPLGSRVFAWPNPFGHTGPFLADDIGSLITGRRVDFYDWRGRESQYAWGVRAVDVWVDPPPRPRAAFEVQGLSIGLTGDWPEVTEQVVRDFAWFRADREPEGCDLQLRIERRIPDFDRFAELRSAFVTPRNVVYQSDGRTVVDYFGRALLVLDRESGAATIQGEDPEIVHEAAYLFLLSRIGEHLDAAGFTRLHSLGLAGAQGAVAILLPSGGGKSTLALRALRRDGVRILSEDSPLLDRRGRLHPFPLRIQINATDAASMPAGSVRRIERMEFHPKMALDLESFRDKIETAPQPVRHIVIGRRSLGREPRLEPLPRRAAASVLFREAVVGVGIYQGMEFVLQRGMRDVAGKAGTAGARAANCMAAVRGARVWELTLGRDRDANLDALLPLLT